MVVTLHTWTFLQLTMVPHQYNIPWFISILSQNMTGTIYQCSHTITPPQPHGACSCVPSQTIAYHRTVPSYHTITPSHRTIAPSHRTIAPYHRTIPSHRTIAPLHRTIAPSHQASYVPDLFRFFQNAVTPILNLDNIYVYTYSIWFYMTYIRRPRQTQGGAR